jgi:hypothetical protein
MVIDRVWAPRLADMDTFHVVAGEMQRATDEVDAKFAQPSMEAGPCGVAALRPLSGWTRATFDQLALRIRDLVFPATLERHTRYIKALERARAPYMKRLRQIERRRQEEDASDLLPFGDAAMERLRSYRLEQAELRKRHGASSPEYVAFVRDTFLPWYNVASTDDRMCERCFNVFALTDSRLRFCSNNCGSAKRMQGRSHEGLSIQDRAAKAALARLDRHMPGCSLCSRGKSDSCGTYARLTGGVDVRTQSCSDEALQALSERRRR